MEPITLIIGAGVAAGAAYFAKNRKATASKTAAATSDIQRRVVAAISTGEPDKLDALAAQLLKEGPDGERAAVSLSALAAQWRKSASAQQAALDAMAKMGVSTDKSEGDPSKLKPVAPPAVAAPEKAPTELDASETVRQLADRLLPQLSYGNSQYRVVGKEDRKLVASFQEAANKAGWKPALKVDGLYGDGTRSALRYYTGQEAPVPRYGAATGKEYKPASASEGGRVDDRYLQGQAVVGTVTGKSKANYPAATRATVAKFQTMMGISPADGLYGKQTIAALKSVGINNPPQAIY